MMQEDLISQAILSMAKQRGPLKSTCPSEIARILYPVDWRRHMEEIRDVAITLRGQGKVLITQKGAVIDNDSFKGPIRIKILEPLNG